MPMLERELGPGVAQALARTADLLREEAEVVDVEVERALQRWYDGTSVDVVAMAESEPVGVRTRVLRHAAIEAGAIASELTRAHVLSLVDLAPGKEIQLPGHVTAYVEGPRLRFRRTPTP
jgi:tRNA(Ile)-lysidine synthase